jgi:Fic family protein
MLRRRYTAIMEARADKRPGAFKTQVNRAGQTVFVAPELVEGTLRHGWQILRSLTEPFHRAAFVMFLVAEVHPFDDGNGRLARAMMNAELIAGEQRRILIPTVYREDYLLALRALSRDQRAEPMLRMLDRAQEFAARIDFADLQQALGVLHACRAFESDTDVILRMPEGR